RADTAPRCTRAADHPRGGRAETSACRSGTAACGSSPTSVTRPAAILGDGLPGRAVGHFSRADPGHFSRALKGINAKRGRFDAFWSVHGPCDIEQLTDEETLEDIVYTYTNAVEAGLVKWAKNWPGFSTYGWRFGERRRFRRPDWFYDPGNEAVPEYVDVVLVRPDIFPELSDDQLYELIQKKVREREL